MSTQERRDLGGLIGPEVQGVLRDWARATEDPQLMEGVGARRLSKRRASLGLGVDRIRLNYLAVEGLLSGVDAAWLRGVRSGLRAMAWMGAAVYALPLQLTVRQEMERILASLREGETR